MLLTSRFYCMIGLVKKCITLYRLVFAVSVVTVFCVFSVAHASTLSFTTAAQTLYVGDTTTVDWFVNTQGDSINVIDARIAYDPQTLEVISFSTGTSAATVWAQDPVVEKPGIIHFVAGLPAGVQGDHIGIVTVTFRARKQGNSYFSTMDSSKVFLNDGFGTSRDIHTSGASFSILPSESKPNSISSPTHPYEDTWYHNKNVVFHFTPKDKEVYSYSFSTNSDIIPDGIAEATTDTVRYNNVADGVYYFKLASSIDGHAWQEAGVYRVQIDTTAPTFLSSVIDTNPDLFDGAPFVSFNAIDKTSGVDTYQVRSGWFGWYHNATSPYEFSRPLIGDSVTIKVRDHAGNTETVSVVYPALIPLWLFILLCCMCAYGVYCRSFLKKKIITLLYEK